jgi:macrodomain Ter protein organizer (MatP/YcbG family)
MAKKERLGSDPFKGGSLNWIHDTREKNKKNDKDVDVKTSKSQSVKTPKRLSSKTSKRQDAKTSKHLDVKASPKRKHTIYLNLNQSKKLRVYAAANEMQLSEVIEKLINDNI